MTNITTKKLLLYALIFAFVISAVEPAFAATTINLNTPVIDGTIYYDGSYTGEYSAEYIAASYAVGGQRTFGFIEFNVTSIPDNAEILDVGFNFWGDGKAGDYTYRYVEMTIQPSAQSWDIAGWTAIYNDINTPANTVYKTIGGLADNTYYDINDTGTGTYTWDISPAADLKTQLINDWFAIGYRPGSGTAGYSHFDSENNTEGHTFPTLWVRYQITSPTISNPNPSDGATGVNVTPCLAVDINYSNFSADLGSWSYWMPIYIDGTFLNHTLFLQPTLIVINSTISALCNGGDSIRFTDCNNITLYDYQIEGNWSNTGDNFIWIAPTNISTGITNKINMFYGNPVASSAESSPDVWGPSYVGVYHMNESSGVPKDSGGYNHDTITQWSYPFRNKTGQSRTGTFYGVNDAHNLSDTFWTYGSYNHSFTFEGWVKFGNITAWSRLINFGGSNGNIMLTLNAASQITFLVIDNTSTNRLAQSTIVPGTGSWYYIAGRMDDMNISVFINGTFEGWAHCGGIDQVAGISVIGNRGAISAGTNGTLDEVRVNQDALNDTQLHYNYDTMNKTAGFITYGTPNTNILAGQTVDVYLLWYNNSNGSFYAVDSWTGLIANQTVTNCSFTSGLDLQPCTTYWWGIHATDQKGNYTRDFFSFTTFCVEPPTNLDCSRINATALNITWTPMSDHDGTTYTIIRYMEGYNPPNINEGIELYNGTSYHINLTGLPEATCYGISAWTKWQAPNGTWMLSSNKATHICCSAGGDYLVYFRYENTSTDGQNNIINLTLFPHSTHLLTIKYTNGLEDYVYIDSSSDNPTSIAAEYDVLYLEAWWNYSVNTSAVYNTTSSYKRRLTTNAMWNNSGNNTFDFYFIVHRPIYNDYRYYYPNLTIYETDFENNLARYVYSYYDFTGDYISSTPNEAYTSIYSFNGTKKLIIHEDYLQANKKVYPVLLYEGRYWQTAYSLTNNISAFIGMCPVQKILEEELYIQQSSAVYELTDVTITKDWNVHAPGGWVYYDDPDLITYSLSFTLYVNNTSYAPIYYLNKTGTNEWNFSAGTMALLNHNYTYIVRLTYVRNVTLDGNTWTFVTKTFEGYFLPGNLSIFSATMLDTILTDVFGGSPFYKPGDTSKYVPYSSLIAMGISLIILLSLLGVDTTGVLPLLGGGISLIGITLLISGLSALYIFGVLELFLAIVLLLGRRKK